MSTIPTGLIIKYIVVLIIVVILTALVSSVYNIIKPNEKYPPYNFTSFPNVNPVDLPDGKSTSQDCHEEIQTCPDGNCTKCGVNNDFQCRTFKESDGARFITTSKNVKLQIPFNTPVCVPNLTQTTKTTTSCNTYTGNWVWSSRNDCEDRNQKQCWSCECKNEGLFGDSSTGCVRQHACNPPNMKIDGNNLTLTDTGAKFLNHKYNVKHFTPGQIYDPNPTFGQPDSTLLLENPYDVDDHNHPLFKCSCASSYVDPTSKQEIKQVPTSLPSDPYACHPDICFPEKNISAATVTGDDITCDCTREGGNKVKIGTGPRKGFCSPDNFCGAGGSHCTAGGTCLKAEWCTTCKCDPNYIQKKCNSVYKTWDSSVTTPCCNTHNPIGYQCVNPCDPDPCEKHNLKCHLPAGDCVCPPRSAKDVDQVKHDLPWSLDKKTNECTYYWPEGATIYRLNSGLIDGPSGQPCAENCGRMGPYCPQRCDVGKLCCNGHTAECHNDFWGDKWTTCK